jgi:hypothetical protein
MKRLLSLMVVALFAITACSSSSKPDKTVSTFLTDLKSGKYVETAAYTDVPIFETLAEDEKQLLDNYFKTMTYSEPTVSSTSGDNATVAVSLTAIDIFTVIQGFIQTVTEQAAADNRSIDDMSDDELDAMLTAALTSPDAPKKDISLNINLKKEGSKWVIVFDDALRAGLFMQDPAEAYGAAEEEFEIIETIEVAVKYLGNDEEIGQCKFQAGEETLEMYCHGEHLETLNAEYLNKDLTISYQVVAKGGAASAEADRLLVLQDIIVK